MRVGVCNPVAYVLCETMPANHKTLGRDGVSRQALFIIGNHLKRFKRSPPSPCGRGAGGEGNCNTLILQALTLTLSRRARGFQVGG